MKDSIKRNPNHLQIVNGQVNKVAVNVMVDPGPWMFEGKKESVKVSKGLTRSLGLHISVIQIAFHSPLKCRATVTGAQSRYLRGGVLVVVCVMGSCTGSIF